MSTTSRTSRHRELLACLAEDLRHVIGVARLVTSTVLDDHQQAQSRQRMAWNVVRQLAELEAVIHRLRTLVTGRPQDSSLLAAAVGAHQVLHGVAGAEAYDPLAFTEPPLCLSATPTLTHASLVLVPEAGMNIATNPRPLRPSQRAEFVEDLQQLRSWVRAQPHLRAPDQLEPVPGTSGQLRQIRWVPRPATSRLGEQVASVNNYETLSVEQLTCVHRVLRLGLGPEQAAAEATHAARQVSAREVVLSAARFGLWTCQSKLPASRVGASCVQPCWLDERWQGIPSRWVYHFAALYNPLLGAWYQITRGDVPDLIGLTPMRQVNYAALLGHVQDGGTLSDFAAVQSRTYRDVLGAWDSMVEYAARQHQVVAEVTAIADALPDRLHCAEAEVIRDLLADLAVKLDWLGMRVAALTSHAATQREEVYQGLRRDLAGRLVELRNRMLSRDPVQWRPEDIAGFYATRRGTHQSVAGDAVSEQASLDTIREEVDRLCCGAPPGTRLELLIELHHALGAALRSGGEPILPAHWRLELGQGGRDHHVWLTFQVWPDIVTRVDRTRRLFDDANATPVVA